MTVIHQMNQLKNRSMLCSAFVGNDSRFVVPKKWCESPLTFITHSLVAVVCLFVCLLKNNRVEYFVKWEGWPDSDNTWEPMTHLEHCQILVQEFENKMKSQ